MIRKNYEAPEIETLQIAVEAGFAISSEVGSAGTDTFDKDDSQDDSSAWE